MARRTALGMALGSWIGGRPSPNIAAGAEEDPLTGEMVNGNGIVTDQADKNGTGVIKSPGLAMRLFNPEGAAKADTMNLDYQTLPAREAQQYKIANAEADDYARHAIAYAKGIDPADVSQQEIQGVRAARGQTIKASGLTPEQYNQMITAQEDYKQGGPQAAGRYRALKEQGAENEERTFQDRGGDVNTGMARAQEAKAAGEQATTITTNEPTRRRIQAGQLAGEEGRQSTTEAILDAEAINRLSRTTGVDPQQIQLEAATLARQLGRQPREDDLRDYILGNKMFEEKNNTPLTLGIDNNRLRAMNDSAPLFRQSVMNEIRQKAAASSQPPGELMTNPTLYKPNVGYTGTSPDRMYSVAKTTNPLYRPGFMKTMAGMDFMPGGSQATGTSGGGQGQFALPGGQVAMPVSAPATNSIAAPQIQPIQPQAQTFPSGQPGLDVWQQIMTRLQAQHQGI